MSTDSLDIIFAMPHPDDIEITCGGTVAKLAKLGYRVGLVHLTDGEPTPRGTPAERARELHAAAEVLGAAHVEVLDLPNRELMDGPAARYAVATVFRRYRPRVVVGMAGRTPGASPDHYQAELIVEAARFYAQLTKWDERFAGTAPHRVDWAWYRPVAFAAEPARWPGTFVVDVTDVYEQKMAAIACYASQFDAGRLERLLLRVRALDATDGARCGFAYGELFGLPHSVPLPDPLALFQSVQPTSGAAFYPPRSG
ncbi:MAG: PIG-L family deacetylase [Phycisphaerales bacterium]|nr:PIG-L family deacetylase [Phycisphaerales bacterium]